ncbi:RNA-binding domain-containing protein [Olivibacter sp. XZL3]|uniref:RNA-binding domain-containing protein n=1 Tax=Olivibacter sp. XZL3 TaxID=1735116 RepID=UPI001066B962|nr:RNA-binding domain-containing protein [Olivibacter sp. XZL3]
MALPVNIEDLLHGHVVEWERLEFKRGWNPEEVIHTICAFANDLNNWGGGYIVIGIAEENGQAVFPVEGIDPQRIDGIQGEVLSLAKQLQPNYFPRMQPYVLNGRHILVLWCPAGDHRPYTAPSTQGKGAQRYSYIRYGSRSIIAKGENLQRLIELTARIPFDDRINRQATINDFDLGLIQAFLQEIKSSLYEESQKMSLSELSRSMHIAKGADEDLYPVNVGLLFFNRTPEKFFSRAWIELVVHRDDSGRSFSEHYFKGPLHIQLRDCLAFLKATVIHENVIKVSYQAEAIRFYNFPYEAVEEALSNAVYHKSYEIGNPIEVQVWPDKIEILSFPGPIPPVDVQILNHQRRIVARDYRNRRIGDFLKELDLTEGRGTGFPTIYRTMHKNGSPDPIFKTDGQSTHFLTILPARQEKNDQASNQAGVGVKDLVFKELDDVVAFFKLPSNQASNQASNQVQEIINRTVHDKVVPILGTAMQWISSRDLLTQIGLSVQSKNKNRYLTPLLKIGWLQLEYPENQTHPNQRYKITDDGNRYLEFVRKK